MTLSGVRVSAVALVLGVCLAGTVDAFGNYARGEAFVPLSGGLPSLGLRLTRGGAASCMMMASKKERVAGIRMDRKDGGGGKISKPGQGGGINKPGAAPGAGGGEGERERGGAGVAVLTKPPELDKASDLEKKEAVDKEPIWRVLLHNDDVHTFDYVIDTIVKVVRTVTRKKAHRITMEAHKSGLATVTTTWKQLAREYSVKLQKAGLTSSIAPENKGPQ